VFVYNSTSKKWVPGSPDNFGAKNLKDLDDTSITSPSSGNLLKYNGSKWINATLNSILPSASSG